jgi:hypothetical protein
VTNDEVSALAYPSIPVLAAGIAGFGVISDCLAVTAAIPAGWDCG